MEYLQVENSKTPMDYPQNIYTSSEEYSPINSNVQTTQLIQTECSGNKGQSLQPGCLLKSSDKPKPYPVRICEIPQMAKELFKYLYSWWNDIVKNSLQANSFLSAVCIFASGGMSLAWSFGFASIYKNYSGDAIIHVQICWFLAVILGACLAAILNGRITKHAGNVLASSLVLVNGITFTLSSESVTSALIGRCCDGIAFGLTLVLTIVVGSEQSAKSIRSYVLSVEQISIAAGMSFYMNFWEYKRMHGILALICGVLALILSFVYKNDSPISCLQKGKEIEAVNTLLQLQIHKAKASETYSMFNENKRLLDEDIARGRALNFKIGLIPMVKLCLFRALVSMSLSLPLLWGFIPASALTTPDDDLLMLKSFPTMRLIGQIFTLYTLDTIGRKAVSVGSLFFGGGLLIGVGYILYPDSELVDSNEISLLKALLMSHQVLAGMAAPISTCYLGEAFSISVKPYFIVIAVIFENIIQIMICCAFNGTIELGSDYEYPLGVLQIIFGFFFIFVMPETKQTTLREALAMFSKVTMADDRT